MITEVVIYSDGTVNSFDADNCQIPSASGSWEIIPLLANWATAQYPSQLPEECRMINAKCYIGVRKKGGDDRLPIPIRHLLKMARYIDGQEYDVRTADLNDVPQSE